MHFSRLARQDLYDLLHARCEVFIVERGPFLDPDGLDQNAWHVLGRDAQGALVAYARILPAGVAYAEVSIGRVLALAAWRGTGAGLALMRTSIEAVQALWPGAAIRISAQAYLLGFYQRCGFVAVGDSYVEDGTPHVEMLYPGAGQS